MEVLNVLISLVPRIVEIAKAGQAAWAEYLDTMKIEGDAALNAKLDALKADFVRIRLIAEFEASN